MLINPETNNTIWYHSTPKERLDSILKEGLRINSIPTFETGGPYPWIYVSTVPFDPDNQKLVLLQIDLRDIPEERAGWPFEDRWQLRVFMDIPAKYINVPRREGGTYG